MVALLLLLVAASPVRSFENERQLLDRRLEMLGRILPDGYDVKADAAHVAQLARTAGLSSVDVLPRPPADATGQDHGFVVVDVSALGLYVEVDRFFRDAALSGRLIDVISLTLTPTPHESVHLATVLRLPYRPAGAPLPPPPEGWEETLRGAPRVAQTAFLRDQALALARSETIARLRRARRNPRLFLSELAAVTRGRPVTLGRAELTDAFRVQGLTIGEGPARELMYRFESGFFRISDFGLVRDGACHRFEVAGTTPVVGIEATLPLPAEDPFLQDESPCRVDRDAATLPSVRLPGNGKAGSGPLTLRLRDVDLADLFFALHRLTGESFVVDGGVTGRVGVDLLGVTLEEALREIAKLGLSISPPGGIRRVALQGAAPRTWPSVSVPPPASFALKRADVRGLLGAMADAEPGLASLGPSGFLGNVSLWAAGVPLLDLRAAMLDAVGLAEQIEEGQRLLQRPTGTEEELTPVVGAARPRRLALAPDAVTPMDFELAGVGSAGSAWLAFAYTPGGTLNAYPVGAALDAGRVVGINSTDVVLGSDEGNLRLPLEPLDR